MQRHITNILTVKNIETMDKVVRSKTSRFLKPVLTRIRRFSTDFYSTDNTKIHTNERLVNFNHKYHQPMEIERLSTQHHEGHDNDHSCVKQLIMAYFCMHEYLCSTIGAARLRFKATELNRLKMDLERHLEASQQYYQNN